MPRVVGCIHPAIMFWPRPVSPPPELSPCCTLFSAFLLFLSFSITFSFLSCLHPASCFRLVTLFLSFYFFLSFFLSLSVVLCLSLCLSLSFLSTLFLFSYCIYLTFSFLLCLSVYIFSASLFLSSHQGKSSTVPARSTRRSGGRRSTAIATKNRGRPYAGRRSASTAHAPPSLSGLLQPALQLPRPPAPLSCISCRAPTPPLNPAGG